MNISQISDLIKQYFSTKKDIHTVMLFGTVVEKYFNTESDIDVAIAGDVLLTTEKKVELHQSLAKLLSRKVDLRDLSTLHGIILSQVLRKGKVAKKENHEYFENKLREMIDFRQDILPFLQEGMERRLSGFIDGR